MVKVKKELRKYAKLDMQDTPRRVKQGKFLLNAQNGYATELMHKFSDVAKNAAVDWRLIRDYEVKQNPRKYSTLT